MSADRTPGPWGRGEGCFDELIVNGNGDIVCRAPNNPSNSINWDANAAAIVRWENHFDELVRALEEIVLRGRRLIISTKDQYVYSAEAEIAFAALIRMKS